MSDGIAAILPRMVTDIILEPLDGERRLVVDTKFILGTGRFGGTGLKSDYLYQMYAYHHIALAFEIFIDMQVVVVAECHHVRDGGRAPH